eukprot:5694025-Pyramimonas_sp.AAC.1
MLFPLRVVQGGSVRLLGSLSSLPTILDATPRRNPWGHQEELWYLIESLVSLWSSPRPRASSCMSLDGHVSQGFSPESVAILEAVSEMVK